MWRLKGWAASWLALAALAMSVVVGCAESADRDPAPMAGDDDDDGSVGDDDDADGGVVDAACDDGRRNGTETDIDCGGDCPACLVGDSCETDDDCVTDDCGADGLCAALPTCTDGRTNGDETGQDCGGPTCDACGPGETCAVDADCASDDCDDGVCRSCADGLQNGTETDVDCGGDECEPCVAAAACLMDTDCASGDCEDGICISCTDGVLNGDETGVDCGGTCGLRCEVGIGCASDDDCTSAICDVDAEMPVCVSCEDGLANGSETDVDCGGPICDPCADLLACVVDDDCVSERCAEMTCVSCEDGEKNGTETDVDCGGDECGGCLDGLACLDDDDCFSDATCVDDVCDSPCATWGTTTDYVGCEYSSTTPPCPDISTSGTSITLGDDDYMDVTIPFTFEFYGTDYTTVRIESNGALTFGSASDEVDFVNDGIPTDPSPPFLSANQEMIAAFWDDLNPSRTIVGEPNEVHHETRGTSPNRTFVVQWRVSHYNFLTPPVTNSAIDVRAVLSENGDRIEVCYVDVDTDDSSDCATRAECHEEGASATAGIQESDTVGLEYSFDTPDLTEDLVLRYDPR